MTNTRATTTTNGAPVSGAARSHLLALAVPGFGRTVAPDRADSFGPRSGYGLSATVRWTGAAAGATGADLAEDQLWEEAALCPECWLKKAGNGSCGCPEDASPKRVDSEAARRAINPAPRP